MGETSGEAHSTIDNDSLNDETNPSCIARRLVVRAGSDTLVELVEDTKRRGLPIGRVVAAGPRSTISAVEAAMSATVDAALGITTEAASQGRNTLGWGRRVVARETQPPDAVTSEGRPE